ncbi:hypothetical protein HQ393_03135 [Chitinibacter bivalviorum]|uniref:Type 4 fimbrial biogenesis protein PilX N-terminal domain-containing protein n=1 Tax=Chitinibacter bivalviorum TaxID=2739434 RepID=A0A7H9BFH5_9NEIS|nr:hypothetical protein [Chitinibacter bivalviorum]QLG87327.1 hypothetical protein HQ393_03135 [Chitinibacter bivalviorum]
MNAKSIPIRVHTQRGVATLLVSIVILIVLGLMTLYTNRSIIIEQKTSANAYKKSLALEAAQSGLENFMGIISSSDDTKNYKIYFDPPTGGGSDWTLKSAFDNKAKINNKGYLNNTNDTYVHNFSLSGLIPVKSEALALAKASDGTDLNGQKQEYSVYLYSITSATPGVPPRFVLISRGCADSCTYSDAFVMTEFTIGQRKICPMEINGKFEGVNGPSIHGTTNISGNPANSVFNCGLSLGSVPTNSGVGTTDDITGCQTGTGCSSNGSADRYNPKYNIQSDPSKDNHFKKYFNKSMSDFKAEATTCVLTGDKDQVDLNTALAGGGVCAGKTTVVISGNFSINASPSPALGADPVKYPNGLTLVVEGDLNMSWGTSTFDGFLYVYGNAKSTAAGSMKIIGSAAFAGDVVGQLSWDVVADAKKARLPSGSTLTANFSSGTWRDF